MGSAKILITSVDNIKDNEVIDKKKITSRNYDSDMDVFTFENIKTGKMWKGNLMHVNLYEDFIVEGKIKYKILHMLIKG